jgi:tetratricopeptide (TPR) repeat protein
VTNQSTMPPHNVSRFRLQAFVGRQAELAQLTQWLREAPVVAITGFSGIGKSSLATALAYALMPEFDEGAIWVSAFGSDEFRIYDIIRAIEDVLVTGITSQSPSQWEILALQQLYGRRRLVILDEVTQATEDTAKRIAETIGRVGPGGPGRMVLVGRRLPPPLSDLVGSYRLNLGGLTEAEASALVAEMTQLALPADDLAQMMQISYGHPLALKLLMPIWKGTSQEPVRSLQEQLREAVADYSSADWNRWFEAMVDLALDDLEASHLAAAQLLTRFTLSRGGGDFHAMQTLYWRGLGPVDDLKPVLTELVWRALLQYEPDEDRYLLHPALRRLLIAKRFRALPSDKQRELAHDHAQYYLTVARYYERTPPQQWPRIERDWANVRQGVEWVTRQLEIMAGDSVQALLSRIDSLAHLNTHRFDDLTLVRDYALALRTYCVHRQPPSGFGWLAAGLVAAQVLGDSWSRTLIGARFCTLVYFQGGYELAETWLQRSLNALVPVDDKPRLSRLWADLGALYKVLRRFEEAIAACEQVRSLNEAMGNWRGEGSALMRIGSIYYASEDMQNALTWHQRALALFQEHDDPGGQAMAHNNVGLVYEAIGEFQQAIHHYYESARLNETLNNVQGMITAYGNLGSASYELGDFRAAIEWYQKDLAMSESLGDWTGMAATLHNMGHVALEMGDLDAARNYFVRSRDLYIRFGLKDFAAEEETLIQIVQDRRVVGG